MINLPQNDQIHVRVARSPQLFRRIAELRGRNAQPAGAVQPLAPGQSQASAQSNSRSFQFRGNPFPLISLINKKLNLYFFITGPLGGGISFSNSNAQSQASSG